MANTRFKTENSLLVTGDTNTQIDTITLFNANVNVNSSILVVNGELTVGNAIGGGPSNLNVTGNLLVAGNLVYTNTNVTGDLRADIDGLDLGNTTNRFDIFIREGYVYSLLNPNSNTITLGNTTQRWVMSGNTLDLSSSLNMTGNLTINVSSFKVSSNTNQVAINTATYSGALNINGGANVTGDVIATSNVTALAFNVANSSMVMNTATINGNTTTVVDQFANSGVRVVKYLAHAENTGTNGKYFVEVVGLNVNAVILVSQYGEVNNVPLGMFNLIKNGANLQLTYIDPIANSTNTSLVTVLRTVIS